MRFIGNFLWFVLGGGFFLGLTWCLAGVIWCITIVGIPVGIACFRIASFSFFPFVAPVPDGKEPAPRRNGDTGDPLIDPVGFLVFFFCPFERHRDKVAPAHK